VGTSEQEASQDELKKQTGYKAVDDYVKSGMVVSLGTGSTAYFAVEQLGQLLMWQAKRCGRHSDLNQNEGTG
jgi:ribose 5-phosphate isomerase